MTKKVKGADKQTFHHDNLHPIYNPPAPLTGHERKGRNIEYGMLIMLAVAYRQLLGCTSNNESDNTPPIHDKNAVLYMIQCTTIQATQT
jgi:hypothetical protein